MLSIAAPLLTLLGSTVADSPAPFAVFSEHAGPNLQMSSLPNPISHEGATMSDPQANERYLFGPFGGYYHGLPYPFYPPYYHDHVAHGAAEEGEDDGHYLPPYPHYPFAFPAYQPVASSYPDYPYPYYPQYPSSYPTGLLHPPPAAHYPFQFPIPVSIPAASSSSATVTDVKQPAAESLFIRGPIASLPAGGINPAAINQNARVPLSIPAAHGATPAKISSSNTIPDVLAANPDFSVLYSALTEAGMIQQLSGPGPFTIYAPTNNAFQKMAAEELAELVGNKEKLVRVLNRHVVQGFAAKVGDIRPGSTPVQSLGGEEVTAVRDQFVRFRSSSAEGFVTKFDIAAENGVIHAIDTVI